MWYHKWGQVRVQMKQQKIPAWFVLFVIVSFAGFFWMVLDILTSFGPNKSELLSAGTEPFESAAWRADAGAKTGARASMIGTLVRDKLPSLTTRAQVHALLGPPDYAANEQGSAAAPAAQAPDWSYDILYWDGYYNTWILRFRFDSSGSITRKAVEYSGL